MASKKTPADYHALAEERSFRWRGPKVSTVLTKTSWECLEGHTWEARYNDIQQGKGCPKCAVHSRAKQRRKKPSDYHALAEESGFHWLGPEVDSVKERTTWKCPEGHRWKARYADIRRGHGCPDCYGNAPKTPADYDALAKEMGLHWLGTEVNNIKGKTEWKCPEGHEWEARYNDIQQGHGCPRCAVLRRADQWRKKPADYEAVAKERGFQWQGPEVLTVLAKTNWKCQEEHEWPARYSDISRGVGCPHCAGKVPKTPADYHLLARECGLQWLEKEVPDTSTPTRWACKEGHEWETSYSNIRMGTRCPTCAGVAPKTPADYRTLAEESGLLWLGPKVPNIHTKTGWECEEGHPWEAAYNSIQQGSGCGKCAVERLAEDRRKKPSDYHALAEESGFRWLGPSVPNNHTKTRWKCKENHCWEATYHSIQSGTGCPDCIDMVAGAPVSKPQRELCDILGGELNRQFGKYKVDVALDFDYLALAVEYDAWYWHAGREEEDALRDGKFISAGWRVLRIRSNRQLPTHEQLGAAIDRLLAGEDWVEIVLDDWGVGPTRFEID